MRSELTTDEPETPCTPPSQVTQPCTLRDPLGGGHNAALGAEFNSPEGMKDNMKELAAHQGRCTSWGCLYSKCDKTAFTHGSSPQLRDRVRLN